MAQPTPRNYAYRGHHKQYAPLTHSKPLKHRVPTLTLTQSKPISNTAVRPLSAPLPNITVTRTKNAHQVVTKSKSPIRRHITRNPSSRTSNSPPRVNVVQVQVVSAAQGKQGTWGNPQQALKDKGVIDSGCSRHMTGNMSYLSYFEELNEGYVAFGGNPKGGKITGKGKNKIGKLDFDNVYFVKVLKFNLFSVSQMCDKKNSVLFTNTECLVLSSDFKLPDESQVLLRAEAVNTACYVQNRVSVTKPHNTTPYELLHGRAPSIGFMRPFGCPMTILNTLDPLGKFKGKVDEGFLVGYSVCSKAFRVFNSRTRIIQETLHVNFLENKPNVAGTQDNLDAQMAGEEVDQSYMLFPVWSCVGSTNPQNNAEDAACDGKEHDFDVKKPESKVILSPSSSAQSKEQDDKTMKEAKGKSLIESVTGYRDINAEFQDCSENSCNEVTTTSSTVPTVGQNSLNITNTFSAAGPSNTDVSPTSGQKANFNNLESSIPVSPIPTTRIHKNHPISQIIGDLSSTTQTRSMARAVKDQGGLSQMFGNDFHTCMFACFLSQEEPKRNVWVLVDLPYGKRAIGTKWVYRNKKDKRGIMIRNKARLVAQRHTHEEGINYEEVVAPVARIEAIRLFLAYASFMGFMVYQMDVKSAFLCGIIKEEVYVCQPPGFEDPDHPDKVYKVVKALYGLHQAPTAWYETLATYLLENDDIIFGATNKDLCRSFEKLMKDKFQMSSMWELTFFLGLQVKQKKDGIFISQDKYVADILRKFGLTEGKSINTPIDTEMPLLKDSNGAMDSESIARLWGFIRFLTFYVSAGAPISAGDPNPAVTSVSAGFSIPAATPIVAGIPIPADDFVPAGHISFLLACSILFLLVSVGFLHP
nr:hypothetical protein [Tanacetum cinerariifolium]